MQYNFCKSKFIDNAYSYCAKDTILFYNNCFIVFEKYLKHINCIDFDMSQLDNDFIKNYIVYLRFTANVKNVSIRTYLRGLRTFINFCNCNYGCNIYLHYKLPKNDSTIKQPLSNSEVNKIISSLRDNIFFERNELIILTMLNCGLRLQEVINLKASDINYDDSMIIIRNTKNNKNRLVPVPQFLLLKMARYNSTDKGFFFTSFHNKQITKCAIENMFHELKKICPRVHPHLLRHTFATSFIMGGGTMEYLRCVMGHSTYAVTQEYISCATELMLCKYDIYKLDKGIFEKYVY